MTKPFNWNPKLIESLDEYFHDWVAPNWFSRVVVHHTWRPTRQQWAGARSMQGIGQVYKGYGWNGGPHFFVAPDGIWQGSVPSGVPTVHSNNCNASGIAIEVVGNYDVEEWPLETQLFVTRLVGRLLQRGNLRPEAVYGHRDCGSDKTCPGLCIDIGWLRHLASLEIGQGPRRWKTAGTVNLRSQPNRQSPAVVLIPEGTELAASDLVIGESVNGNPRWLRLSSGTGYIHTSVVTDIPARQEVAYTQATPILGTTGADPSRVAATVSRLWPHSAYNDEDVRRIVLCYFALCNPAGVNPLVAIAQALHETGGFGESWWSQPPRHNFAGLGVTGARSASRDDFHEAAEKEGTWFEGQSLESPAAGVAAHVGRLLAYSSPPGQMITLHQESIAPVLLRRPLPTHIRGSVGTLQGLRGTWAVPGTAYPEKVAAIASALHREGTA